MRDTTTLGHTSLWMIGAACLALVGCATDPDSAGDPSDPLGGKGDSGGASFAGSYDGPGGATMHVHGGEVVVELPDGNDLAGPLDRDGTLGAAYTIRVAEGNVCGTYRISLIESEGVIGDGGRVTLTWQRPAGSVVQQCGFMLAGEGRYARLAGVDTYCGDATYSGANDLDPEAPLVDSFVLASSSNAKVAQVIAKYGTHTVELVYEDAAHMRRFAAAVASTLRYGHTSVCFEATAEDLSTWGTPVAVFPLGHVRSADSTN